MTRVLPCWCNYCLHYVGYQKCRAFPGGIPDGIIDGSHSTPVPGDGGITFTLDPAKRDDFERIQPYLPA
jgi:hypothetical protein